MLKLSFIIFNYISLHLATIHKQSKIINFTAIFQTYGMTETSPYLTLCS